MKVSKEIFLGMYILDSNNKLCYQYPGNIGLEQADRRSVFYTRETRSY